MSMLKVVTLVVALAFFGGATPVLAEDYRSASIDELAGSPEEFEGRVITGGYLQLVGYAHFSEGSGPHQTDNLSVTYKMWTNPEFQGTSIFVAIEDKNSSEHQDNLPTAPIIVEGAFNQLEGDWEQHSHIASPEITPGSEVWALRAHGFD